jgi:hypothetical protein
MEHLVKKIDDKDFDIDSALNEFVAGLEDDPNKLIESANEPESSVEQRYRQWQNKLRAYELCREKEKSEPRKCNGLAQSLYTYSFSMSDLCSFLPLS